MRRPRYAFAVAALVALAAVAGSSPWWRHRIVQDRAADARRRVAPKLDADLRARGSSLGAPVFIRIFKEPPVLELWTRASREFMLFKTYPICRVSGTLGPKTREGDRQAPEGLYTVGLEQLNPTSRFYLSMNLGYPNQFEKARGWTGDSLMIHGGCVSVGCFAMGDDAIAEIYTAVHEALRSGQSAVSVQALPFPLDPPALALHADSPSYPHWQALAEAFQAFDRTHVPPTVAVTQDGYHVTSR